MEVELPHEPRIEGLPLAARCFKLDLEVSEERGYQLVNFQETTDGVVSKGFALGDNSDGRVVLPDVLADASTRAGAELEHSRLHLLQLSWWGIKPALRSEVVDIFAEDLGSAVQDPGIAADNGSTGNLFSADFHSLRRHDAFENETGCWVKSERFLDHGVKERQSLAFLPSDFVVRLLADRSVARGFVELFHQLLVSFGVLDEVVEDAAKADGRGLRTGEHHAVAGRQYLLVGHELGVVVLRLGEFGEQVDSLAARFIRLTRLADFAHLAFASGGLLECESSHWEHLVRDAPSLQRESDRVLLPHQIKQRHLPNWASVREEPTNEFNNPFNVLVLFDKAEAFTPCQVANDIEGKELQPLCEITGLAGFKEPFLRLLDEHIRRAVYQRLVVH